MFGEIGEQMRGFVRSLGSLLPQRRPRRDRTRVVRPWVADYEHSYPSVGLTPSRALALLHAADGGSPQTQFELFAEMLQKWPRLAAVESTRRLALTGLEWEITGSGGAGGESALRAADYCAEVLGRIPNLRAALDHLAHAIGFGIAVVELVWERGELIDLTPVPYSRLVSDSRQPWRLRVLTEDEPSRGVPLDEQPNKWLVHQPTSNTGRYFEGGLLRASVLLYLAQNLSFKDWLIYSQVAGMPVRVARYEPGTADGDKQQLLRMLEALGTDAVAVFSKNVDLQFIEAARGSDKPYQALQDYCNTEITILWLGQHLTTDVRASGSRAAAEVHDRVREDLLVDDIADEGWSLRRDVLTPMVRARFGGEAAPPLFRRSLVQAVDTKKLAETLAIAVRDLGVELPQRWLHRALGIPEALPGEAVLAADGARVRP